jgi:hypothetical protein
VQSPESYPAVRGQEVETGVNRKKLIALQQLANGRRFNLVQSFKVHFFYLGRNDGKLEALNGTIEYSNLSLFRFE